jgi:hypothetical protein
VVGTDTEERRQVQAGQGDPDPLGRNVEVAFPGQAVAAEFKLPARRPRPA